MRAELLAPNDAAKILGLSPSMVRVLCDTDRLPCMRTVSGRRFITRAATEALKRKREKKVYKPANRRKSSGKVIAGAQGANWYE